MIRTYNTRFAEARLFEPDVFEDERGYFKEIYSRAKYAALGLHEEFVQDNISRSRGNVIRGMHYDLRVAKLVQSLVGTIYDVIVDMREGSSTYRQWESFELSEDNHRQLYVPAGFAHGFLSLTDQVVVSYKQTDAYDPAHERGVGWDDPALGIVWPLSGEPIVSAKDRGWARIG